MLPHIFLNFGRGTKTGITAISLSDDPYNNFDKLITVNISEEYPLFSYEVKISLYATNINIIINNIQIMYLMDILIKLVNYNEERKK